MLGTTCTLVLLRLVLRSQPSRSASAGPPSPSRATGILSTASLIDIAFASPGAEASGEPTPAPAAPNGLLEACRSGGGAPRMSVRTASANVGLRARQQWTRTAGAGQSALDEERYNREKKRHERVRNPVDDLQAREPTGGEAQARY
jgi:hypothetical protein